MIGDVSTTTHFPITKFHYKIQWISNVHYHFAQWSLWVQEGKSYNICLIYKKKQCFPILTQLLTSANFGDISTMAKICKSFSVPAIAIVCIFFSSVAFADRYSSTSSPLEPTIRTYKDRNSKDQINIYLGDQFIVDYTLKWNHRGEQLKNVALLNVTQSVTGISTDVNIVLTRADNSLFTVTSVSPVTAKFGRSATVLSSSSNCRDSNSRTYVTEFYVQNNANEIIPLSNVRHECMQMFRNSGWRSNINKYTK